MEQKRQPRLHAVDVPGRDGKGEGGHAGGLRHAPREEQVSPFRHIATYVLCSVH